MEVIFDGARWYIALDNYESALNAFKYLVSDEQSLVSHVRKRNDEQTLRMRTVLQEPPDEAEDEQGMSLFMDWTLADLHEAYKIQCRQSIVIVVAHIEELLKEYLRCLFYKYPVRMYDYLHPGTDGALRGKIDLKEIVEAGSKDALVYSLATQAATVALQGRFVSATHNLVKLTKEKVNKKLLSDVIKLVEQRNRIVHELSQEPISANNVEDAFNLAYSLLWHLEAVAIQLDIPVIEPERAKQGPVSKDGDLWYPESLS